MAETIICTNRLGVLAPVDQRGRDIIGKLKVGQQVQVEVKRARNGRQHRLYWALIGLIFTQQDRYATQEQLSNIIKCAVGWCDQVELQSGKLMVTPRSIAFANMPQDQFEEFFSKVMQLVITKILPGVKEDDLRRELEQMTGVAA